MPDPTPTGVALRLRLVELLAPRVAPDRLVDLATRAESYILGPLYVARADAASTFDRATLAAAGPGDLAPGAARDVPPGESWAFVTHRTLAEVGPCDTCGAVTRCLNAGPGGRCDHHRPADPATAPEPTPDPVAVVSGAVVRDMVARGERITGAGLARALGVSQVTGSARLRDLVQAGLVRRVGKGAGTRYELVEEGEAVAAPDVAADPYERRLQALDQTMDEIEPMWTAAEPVTAQTLAARMGVCKSTASARLSALVVAGRVARAGAGSQVRFVAPGSAEPEPIPAPARAPLPEDCLVPPPAPDTAAPADLDTVVDWLRGQGHSVEREPAGTWIVNGLGGCTAKGLLAHTNQLRQAVGLPPFRVRRI